MRAADELEEPIANIEELDEPITGAAELLDEPIRAAEELDEPIAGAAEELEELEEPTGDSLVKSS